MFSISKEDIMWGYLWNLCTFLAGGKKKSIWLDQKQSTKTAGDKEAKLNVTEPKYFPLKWKL